MLLHMLTMSGLAVVTKRLNGIVESGFPELSKLGGQYIASLQQRAGVSQMHQIS